MPQGPDLLEALADLEGYPRSLTDAEQAALPGIAHDRAGTPVDVIDADRLLYAVVAAVGADLLDAEKWTLRRFITGFAADSAVAELFAAADGLDTEKGRLPQFRDRFHQAFHQMLGERSTAPHEPIVAVYRQHGEQLVNAAFTAAAAAHRRAASAAHATAYAERLTSAGVLDSSAETFAADVETDIVTASETAALYHNTAAPMPYVRGHLHSRFSVYRGGASFALKFRGIEQGFKEAYDINGPHAAELDTALYSWSERYWRPESGAWSLETHLRHLPRHLSEAVLGLPVGDENALPVGLRGPRAETEPSWVDNVTAAPGPDLEAMPYPHEVAGVLETINDLFSTDVEWILELTRTVTASPYVTGLLSGADAADDVTPALEQRLRTTLHSGLLAANKTEGAAVLAQTDPTGPGPTLLRRMVDYALAYHRPDLTVTEAAAQALSDIDHLALDAMLDPEGIPYEAGVAEAYLRSLLRQSGMGKASEGAAVESLRRYARSVSGIGTFHAPEGAANRRAQFVLDFAELRQAETDRGLAMWPEAFAGTSPETDRLIDAAFAVAAANYRAPLAGESYQWLNLVFAEAWRIPQAVRDPFQTAISRVVHDPDIAVGGVDSTRTAVAIGQAIAETFEDHPEWMGQPIAALLPGHDRFEPDRLQVLIDEAIRTSREYHHLATDATDLRESFPWAPPHTLGRMLRACAATERPSTGDTNAIAAALLNVPGLSFTERHALAHFAGALAETRPGAALLAAPADDAAAGGDRYARAFAALAAAYLASDPLRPSPKPVFDPDRASHDTEAVLRAVAEYGIRHHQAPQEVTAPAAPGPAVPVEPEERFRAEPETAEAPPATTPAAVPPSAAERELTEDQQAALDQIRTDESGHQVDLHTARSHLIAFLDSIEDFTDNDRAAILAFITDDLAPRLDHAGLIRPGAYESFTRRLQSELTSEYFIGGADARPHVARALLSPNDRALGESLRPLAWHYCTTLHRTNQRLNHRDNAIAQLTQAAGDDRVRLQARSLLRALETTYVDAERQAVAANHNYFTDYRDFAEQHLTEAVWAWILERDEHDLGVLIRAMERTPAAPGGDRTLFQAFTDTMLGWAAAQWEPFDPEQELNRDGQRLLPPFADQLTGLPAAAVDIALGLASTPDWAALPVEETPEEPQLAAAEAVPAAAPASTAEPAPGPAPAERSWRTSAALQAAAKEALYAQATEPGSPAITSEHEDTVLLGLEFLADALVVAGQHPDSIYHPTSREDRDLLAALAKTACTAGPELLDLIDVPGQFDLLRHGLAADVLTGHSTAPAPAEPAATTASAPTGEATQTPTGSDETADSGEPLADPDTPSSDIAAQARTVATATDPWADLEDAATDTAGNPLDLHVAEAFLTAVLKRTGLNQAGLNDLGEFIDEVIATPDVALIFDDSYVNGSDRFTAFDALVNAMVDAEFDSESEYHHAWQTHSEELAAAAFYTASARYRAAECAEHRDTLTRFNYNRLPGEDDLPALDPMLDAIGDYIATELPGAAACTKTAWPATSRPLLDHLRQTLEGTELAAFPDLFDPSTAGHPQLWQNAADRREAIREWAARYWRPDRGGPAFTAMLAALTVEDIRHPNTNLATADAAPAEDLTDPISEAAGDPADADTTAPATDADALLTADAQFEAVLDQIGLPIGERVALQQALLVVLDDTTVAAWFNDPAQTDLRALFADHLERLLEADFDPNGAIAEAWREWKTPLTDAAFTLAAASYGAQPYPSSADETLTSPGAVADVEAPAADEPDTGAAPDGPRPAPVASGPPSGEKARIDANLAVIELLQTIDQDGRAATDTERDILASWSGWGAVPGIFDADRADLAERRERLRALLTDEEYAAASANTLNAHYTDPAYTRVVWDALAELGFADGRVLEPGCGSGNFLSHAPLGIDLTGVELDPITARIAAHLHPEARILSGDFAEAPLARDSFDAAVGNVPFGKFTLYDPAFNPNGHSIHNAFILKAVQLVRPGGIVAVLTSRYTMDARNPGARRDIAAHADLLGAVRLPTGAHQGTAGTKVVTDLLLLRRREDGAEPHPGAPAWELSNTIISATSETREASGASEAAPESGTSAPLYENEYFSQAGSPHHRLGRAKVGAGEGGRPELVIDGPTDPVDVAEAMRSALSEITERARQLGLTQAPAPEQTATVKPVAHVPVPVEALNDRQYDGFHIALDDGTFARYLNGVPITHEVPATEADELRALIELRDTTIRLLDAEAFTAEQTPEITSLRRQLNEQYDRYTNQWGPINRVTLTESTYTSKKTGAKKTTTRRNRPRQGGFRADPHMGLVYGLEHYDENTGTATKLDIFRKRVTGPRPKPTGAETAADALAICLDEHSSVDLAYIARLLGTDEATARTELGTLVYTDPETDTLVTADEYCSGDIRVKLEAAREAAALDPAFEVNVAALTEIVPPWLTMTDIEPEFGAAWIPPEDIQQFLREILADPNLQVHYGGGARWDIRGSLRNSVENFEEWGTDARPATDIVERILRRKNLDVYNTIGHGKNKQRVFDPVGTAAAVAKSEALRDAFKAWLRADPARSQRLEVAYNHQFNALVQRKFDGSHLTFPGMSLACQLRPHQKDAVAQMIAEPSMGLFHEVGLGKTWTIAAGLMEMRRLGLVKKPAIVVPKNVLEQFAREFRELYPRAKLLVADSTDMEDRRAFLGRCTNGDWDAVIFTKESFQKIAVSAQWQRQFITGEIDVLTGQINDLKKDRNRTVKQAEADRKRAQARLQDQLNWAKDTEIEFEATGLDYIAVDEAHNYKNLGRHSNTRDLSHKGNKLTADMLMKLTYLRQYYDRVTTFATGTPVTNSIAEVHSYSRYLSPELLRRHDTEDIDRWSANWATITSRFEIDAMGSFGTKQRLSFHNVPELFGALRTFCDFKTAADIGLPRPELAVGEDGERAPQTVIVEASPELQEIMLEVVEVASKNFFQAMDMARKVAVDTRMLGVETDHDQKAEHVAENVARIWAEHRNDVFTQDDGKEHPNPGALQIIFCDFGVPGEDKEFDAYSEIKRQLIARGMSADRIRFIHEAGNSKESRDAMFEAARNGEMDVLIGSTQRMGTGTNMQARAVALHHFDTPWRAADVQQREGRIVRQGNQYDEVEIYRYAVAGSFDAFMWGHVARKGRNWAGVLAGDPTIRTIDDLEEEVLSFDQIAALATGNPLILEHAEAAAEVSRLEQLAFAHKASQTRLHRRIGEQRAEITRLTAAITDTRAALPHRTATISGKTFTATINDTIYTEYTAATDAIRTAAAALLAPDLGPGTTRVIGSFGGFDITATTISTGKKVHLSLAGVPGTGATYNAEGIRSAGPLRTLANQLEGLEEAITAKLARIDQIEADIDTAKARVGRAFDRAGDLDAARERLEEIEQQMKPRPVDADFVENSSTPVSETHTAAASDTGTGTGTDSTEQKVEIASFGAAANAVTATAFPDPAPAQAPAPAASATPTPPEPAPAQAPAPAPAPAPVRSTPREPGFVHLSYSWSEGVILRGLEYSDIGGTTGKLWGLNWSKAHQRWGMVNTRRRAGLDTAAIQSLAANLKRFYTLTADAELGLDLPETASLERPRLRLALPNDDEGLRVYGSTYNDDANTVLQPLGLTYRGRYLETDGYWHLNYGTGRDRAGNLDWPLIARIERDLTARGFEVEVEEHPDRPAAATAATTVSGTGPVLVVRANDREGITISGTERGDGAREIIRKGPLRNEGLDWSRRNNYWYVRGSEARRGGWKPDQIDRIRTALEAGGFTVQVEANLPQPEPAPEPPAASDTRKELRFEIRDDQVIFIRGLGETVDRHELERQIGQINDRCGIENYKVVNLDATPYAAMINRKLYDHERRPLHSSDIAALGAAYQEHFPDRCVVLVVDGKEVYPASEAVTSPTDTAFPSASPSREEMDLVTAAEQSENFSMPEVGQQPEISTQR